jgi:signal transduction histidine kinase/CheY-like chemotaxis protein/ABC-type amino acid transport substrate-binding protein
MKKLWLLLISLLALGGSLASTQQPSQPLLTPRLQRENSSSSVVLKALADPSEEPYFCCTDEVPMGILPEIAALLGQQSHYAIEMLPVTDYADYQAHLSAKDYDLLLDASDLLSDDLLSGYDLTDTYLDVSYSKAILRNSGKTLSAIACLGENSMAGVYTRSFYYASQITTYDTMEDCLTAVKNEECYAAIINSIYAQKLQNEDIRSIYSFTKLSEGSHKIKIAVKHSDDDMVLSALNAAIASTSEDSYNAIVSRYSHFVKPTPSFWDQLYLNPAPYIVGLAGLILVFVAIIFVIFYSGRRKAILLANHEFERFITYVCQTNAAVFEVNLQNGMMNRYQMEKGKVKNIHQPFSMNQDFLEKIAPEDQAMALQEMDEKALRGLIAEGGEKSFEVRLKEGDGSYFWAYIIVQGILASRAQPANYMVFIRSIDAQKKKDAQARALLQNAVNQAETASKSKSEFLARMSHEIRTPLNAIIGLATIARHYEDDPSKVDDCLTKIDSSSKVLLSLINDILDMSAIENNKMKLASAPFDLLSSLENLRDIYLPQCQGKKIKFVTNFVIPDPLVEGDELRISQILLNLLSNAYKFTPDGGEIHFEAHRSSLQEKKVYYRFVVKDNGVGMSEELQKRLFRPFEQENAETAQKYGGSGLGLSIVKSLVSMMGGSIAVDSSLAHGTTFVIDLPFLLSSENIAEGAAEKELAQPLNYDFEGQRVMLVEDNPINREIAVELLKMANLKTDCATNGEEAVAMFNASKENEYSLILMDIQMPLMDGYEATKAIRAMDRKDAKSIPIYAMTANAYSEDVTHALSSGMNGHIAKPIDPATLYRTIAEALDPQ